MGTNVNQIATFDDLDSIGYRTPKSTKECVTYEDLSLMEYANETDLKKMVGITLSGNSDRLVKWENIPGSSGQDASTYFTSGGGVRCPVKCTIVNNLGIATSTSACQITFYYNYKKNNGSTGREVVGYIQLGINGSITSQDSGICYVLANPVGLDDTGINWLSVRCGTETNKLFSCEYSLLSSSGQYRSVGDSTGSTYEIWTNVMDIPWYNEQLQDLEAVRFTIRL